jgi:hypothetical protein
MADSDPIGHLGVSNLDTSTMAAVAGGNAKKVLGL